MKSRALEGLMIALCFFSRPCAAQLPGLTSPPAGEAQGEAPALLLVQISINGQVQDGEIFAARDGDLWLFKPPDLDRFKIRADGAPRTIEGEAMAPLPAGITASFDTARQQLDLIIPPDLFAAQRISGPTGLLQPTQGTFAAFLNYDLAMEYDDKLVTSGFFEAAISDDWGLIASTMAVGQTGDGTGSRAVRLDSYFIRDDPEGMRRLIVGDTITSAPEWSRQIRYGGVRYGTEFALRPNLVTFPTPAFVGRTAVPSNVELLVNDAVRFQTEVDQGPFSISQVPLVTGAGEVTLVVRDALGVERRVRTPYYVSPRLLADGLSAWSVEAGAERRDYGIESFHYRNAFAAGSYRLGVTDWLTVEARGEASGNVQMAGGGVSLVWPMLGEFSAAAAGSRGKEGSGGLFRISFARITPHWNLSLSYQQASRQFDQLGIDRDEERITRQFQAAAGVTFDNLGNMVVSWTDLQYGDGTRTRVGSANYSVSVGSRAYMSLFAIRSEVTGVESATTVGIGLTVPLGAQTSVYAQADQRNRLAEVRRTAPFGGGWGYRVAASQGESDRQQAEVQWRGAVGEANLAVARFEGNSSLRMLASGGVMAAGGGVHATRRIENGFGVVEVPGQANVRILQENRLVARTGRNGTAIIPDLRAYEANRISLEPSDLPLDVRMPSDTMVVVPRVRGAVRARFDVEKDTPGTVIVTMADGRRLAGGTNVRTADDEEAFAGQDGAIFVQKLRDGLTLEIETEQGVCRATVGEMPAGETLPRIGPIPCVFGQEDAR